jgi:hypothetical protein
VVFAEDGTPRQVHGYREYAEQEFDGKDPQDKNSWLSFLLDKLNSSLPYTSLKRY